LNPTGIIEIGDGWTELLSKVREAFNADHPDAAERLKQLENQRETS
jgi:hypothetical protein